MKIPDIALLVVITFGPVVSIMRPPFSWMQSSANQAQPAPPNKSVVDRATGLALQGDSASAVRLLSESSKATLQGEDAAFRTCMLDRFGTQGPQADEQDFGDPWITSLATIYLKYWKHSLTKPAEKEPAEDTLRVEVAKLLDRTLSTESEFDAAEEQITEQIPRTVGPHTTASRTDAMEEIDGGATGCELA